MRDTIVHVTNANKYVGIEVDSELVENQTFGLNVCDVSVNFEDGKYSKFFVTVRIKNGRPVCEVSTNLHNKETKKSITGVKRVDLRSKLQD